MDCARTAKPKTERAPMDYRRWNPEKMSRIPLRKLTSASKVLAFIAVALVGLIPAAAAVSLKEINPPQTNSAKHPLAIVGVTLINGRGSWPIPDAGVVLPGEK